MILNYARTGDDPLDGDSVAVPFKNPADIDVTTLKVLIIEGNGQWIYNEETGTYSWNNAVTQSYSKTAWCVAAPTRRDALWSQALARASS